MKIKDPGHKYILKCNREESGMELTFFKDKEIHGEGYAGVTVQEVLRACINRTQFLENEVHHDLNKQAIYHMRKALACFEMRYIDRLADKNIDIENIATYPDHFIVSRHDLEEK